MQKFHRFILVTLARSLWLCGSVAGIGIAMLLSGYFPGNEFADVRVKFLSIAAGIALLTWLPLTLANWNFQKELGFSRRQRIWYAAGIPAYFLKPFFYWRRGNAAIRLLLIVQLLIPPLAGLAICRVLPEPGIAPRVLTLGLPALWAVLAGIIDFGMLPHRSAKAAAFATAAGLLPLLLPVTVQAVFLKLERDATRDWQRTFADLRRAGMPLNYQDLRRRDAAISPNAAPLYREAFAIESTFPEEFYPLITTLPVRNPPREKLREWLKTMQPFFTRLDQAAKIPQARFEHAPLWQDDFMADGGFVDSAFRHISICSGLRQLAAPEEFTAGWFNMAIHTRHANVTFGLSNYLSMDCQELIRLDVLQRSLLMDGWPSSNVLELMIRQLDEQETFFRNRLMATLEEDRAIFNEGLDFTLDQSKPTHPALPFDSAVMVSSRSKQVYSRLINAMIAALSGDYFANRAQFDAIRRQLDDLRHSPLPLRADAGIWDKIPLIYYRLIAKIRCAKQALASELYRRKHGVYPPDAAALTPEFLSTVPLNPFDGKELTVAVGERDVTVIDAAADYRKISEKHRMITVSTPNQLTRHEPSFSAPAMP